MEVAEQHLQVWLDAELALATAQEYTITTPNGSRTLKRANLNEVLGQVKYWQRQVEGLSRSSSRQLGSAAAWSPYGFDYDWLAQPSSSRH